MGDEQFERMLTIALWFFGLLVILNVVGLGLAIIAPVVFGAN